jgi:hypothetical protein
MHYCKHILCAHTPTTYPERIKETGLFFSHTPVAQPLASIQEIFDEMKTGLTLIKGQFQRQISSGSVDLCTAWKSSLSLVDFYSQASIRIRELVSDYILKAIDFHLRMPNFRSESSSLKTRLAEIKRMVNFDDLSGAIQSLFGLIPLIDIYFSGLEMNPSWTTEAIAQFKTSVRTIFSSEFCVL